MSRLRERAPYRGALIGYGGIARQAHLPGFRDARIASRFEIVAAVDPRVEPGTSDGMRMVRDPADLEALGIDFVDICTPTSSHLPLTLWALERGYHVLCEKPVAVSRGECTRVRATAARANRVVMPCHQYRFNPVWRRVRDWLDTGVIGRWHLAEFHVYRPTADPGAQRTRVPWRGERGESRGGVLLDHGTHLIYELLDVAGPPLSIDAWTGRLRHRQYDVEDTAHLLLKYRDRLGVMFLTWAALHRENRLRFIGELGTIEWTGGILRLERDGAAQTFDMTAQLDKACYPLWFADLFAEFARTLDDGDGARHLDDIADVAGVLEDAYRAAGTSGRGHLPGAA